MNTCAKCGSNVGSHGFFMCWRKGKKRAWFLICVSCHDEIRKNFPVEGR